MKQYRVSLWVKNQGSLPDFDVQFQVINAAPNPSKLAMAAFLLIDAHWARLVEIQVLHGDQWVEGIRATNVTLYGTSELWFNSSSVK